MNIIKHGKKATTGLVTKSTIRSFYCESCGCVYTADLNEYFLIREPILPNCFSTCPECGSKVWYKGTDSCVEDEIENNT